MPSDTFICSLSNYGVGIRQIRNRLRQ